MAIEPTKRARADGGTTPPKTGRSVAAEASRDERYPLLVDGPQAVPIVPRGNPLFRAPGSGRLVAQTRGGWGDPEPAPPEASEPPPQGPASPGGVRLIIDPQLQIGEPDQQGIQIELKQRGISGLVSFWKTGQQDEFGSVIYVTAVMRVGNAIYMGKGTGASDGQAVMSAFKNLLTDIPRAVSVEARTASSARVTFARFQTDLPASLSPVVQDLLGAFDGTTAIHFEWLSFNEFNSGMTVVRATMSQGEKTYAGSVTATTPELAILKGTRALVTQVKTESKQQGTN